jgi:diguanylate cyclase (GGDEF)-like protein
MKQTVGKVGHPALTDGETGLPNRLHFDTVFEVLFATGSRGVPMMVLLLEMEDFEAWAGSGDPEEVGRILRSVGGSLAPLVRQSDLVARTGEDRFSFCLLDCNMAGAVLVADRIDDLLDSVRARTKLGFSLGGAAFNLEMKHSEDLVGAAEEALRTAQDRGPNQMEFIR